MLEKPELIATLQVGMAASGECSECHEVFIVKGPSSKPEPLSNRLRQIFEEHVRGVDPSNVDPSKKAIELKRQFGLTGKGDADTLFEYRSG